MISLSRDLKQKRKLWKLNIPLQMFTKNRTRKGNERSSSMCAWVCFFVMVTKKAVQRASEAARASLSCKLVELLRSKCSALRSISIAQLNTLLHLHLRPIKLVVYKWPYSLEGMGYLILRCTSRLDAFSVYYVRTRLPGYALGRTTDAPEVRPTRSSRTKVSSSQISNAHDR